MRRLALFLLCSIACRPAEGRERRDFERMRRQQRYDAYDRSTFFRNGAVMQAPPAHTIARPANDPWSNAVMPMTYLTGSNGSTDVADTPIPVDDRVGLAGARQYAISCALCHGAAGNGDGIMVANLRPKAPPPLIAPPIATLPAGTIFKVITDGFGTMPPYGWQIPIDTRWAVVAYVQSLAANRR